jgi:hypothetical protein
MGKRVRDMTDVLLLADCMHRGVKLGVKWKKNNMSQNWREMLAW